MLEENDEASVETVFSLNDENCQRINQYKPFSIDQDTTFLIVNLHNEGNSSNLFSLMKLNHKMKSFATSTFEIDQ
jgi:hypothetical protein